MGIQFAVDPTSRVVHYDVVGKTSSNDAGQFLNAVLTHPRFERGFNFLGDCREAEVELNATCIRAITAELRAWADFMAPCRWAVVISSETMFSLVETRNTTESSRAMSPRRGSL